jgi:hypothetical protein
MALEKVPLAAQDVKIPILNFFKKKKKKKKRKIYKRYSQKPIHSNKSEQTPQTFSILGADNSEVSYESTRLLLTLIRRIRTRGSLLDPTLFTTQYSCCL